MHAFDSILAFSASKNREFLRRGRKSFLVLLALLLALLFASAKCVFQRSVLQVQFLLVLSAYKTSHQWLQHPSNTANTLCGSDLGAAEAEGYLWWPDAGNTALSYCVQACPQAAGDQSLIIGVLQQIRSLFLQEAGRGHGHGLGQGHGHMCLFNNASFLLGPTTQYPLQSTLYAHVTCLGRRCSVTASPFVVQVHYV